MIDLKKTTVLQVKNVSKKYGKKSILNDISFELQTGDIVGLVGSNGAGKTTTLKLISSLVSIDQGQILINGFDIKKEREKALQNLSSIIETPGLYPYFTGLENLEYLAAIHQTPREELTQIISDMGMTDYIKQKVKKYSLGMKQRLAIGMSLINSPKLLILDEPTNGLDPSAILELRQVLKDIVTKRESTILISSHNLSEIEKICNKIIFIQQGVIVNIIDQEVKENKRCYRISFLEPALAIKVLNDLNIEVCETKQAETFVYLENGNLSQFIKLLIEHQVEYDVLEPYDSIVENQYHKIYQEASV